MQMTWGVLHSILQRHEERIRKIWLKKSEDKRKQILLAAMPDLHLKHRPDMQAWKSETGSRAAWMWPFLNLEDLLNKNLFLLLLNSRGRHHPSTFAYSDLESLRLGITQGGASRKDLVETFGITMHLQGQGVSYGMVRTPGCTKQSQPSPSLTTTLPVRSWALRSSFERCNQHLERVCVAAAERVPLFGSLLTCTHRSINWKQLAVVGYSFANAAKAGLHKFEC